MKSNGTCNIHSSEVRSVSLPDGRRQGQESRLTSGSQCGMVLPPRRHLYCLKTFLVVTIGRAGGGESGEAGDRLLAFMGRGQEC